MRHALVWVPLGALATVNTVLASTFDPSSSGHSIRRARVHNGGRALRTSNDQHEDNNIIRRMHKVVIQKRQGNLIDQAESFLGIGGGEAEQTGATSAAAAASSNAVDEETSVAAVTTTPAARTTTTEPDPVETTTTRALVPTTTTTTPQPVRTTTTEAAETTRPAQTTVPAQQRTSDTVEEDQQTSSTPLVRTITSTSINSSASSSGTSSSAKSSASAVKSNESSGSSGISKPALIAIIVAASCVAIVLVSWTIFRKVVFSPSRRFESKLAPIEFKPDHDPYGAGADRSTDDILTSGAQHGRAASVRSAAMSERYGALGRSGSEKSSLRGMTRADTSYPASIPYSGPGYYQQPYHGGSSYGNAQPGWPSEPAYNYNDLQRGASVRTDLSRLPSVNGVGSRTYGSMPYDYQAQQRDRGRPW
ncbi:hypothetical protein OIO90_001104 [Microbotryomycetes sp. JL221]|nr:hypothetical protein OIO90_001104 [Microbotryomycetes sp. JL221]